MRNYGGFLQEQKTIIVLRDDGGVPRKTAGFVGCRRGRHPLRLSNSRGNCVGDDVPDVPPINSALPLHNTNMPQKTATPYMVKTVFPQWDAAPRIPV